MDAQTRILPNQHQAEGVLRALGETLPDADLSRLRDFLSGVAPLDVSDVEARQIVDALKTAADRHWRIDPHRSVELAEAIIAIGEARADVWIRALGTMAKGDAVKFIGSQQEAWDLLEESARLFALVSDEVGWARTWIGRVFVAAQLNRLPEAIAQAERAREIFERQGETLRQMRLDWGLGQASWQTEDLIAADGYYRRALTAESVVGPQEVRGVYHNLGLIALHRGDPQQALGYFERSAHLAHGCGDEADELTSRVNIASARLLLGHFRQALALFNEIRPRRKQLVDSDARIAFEMAECLEALDRHADAAILFRQARQEWLGAHLKLEAARTALFQAMAEANLGDLMGARVLLDTAEVEFDGLRASGLLALVRLRRGQLALRQGDTNKALEFSGACALHFLQVAQVHYLCEALLLQADAQLKLGELALAAEALTQALECARASASPPLLYAANLSLGRLAELQGRDLRALRRFAAAEATLERMQRNLTVSLRPAFLANKLDAQRGRVRLQIKAGQISRAFETVERMRAQIALGYLTGREALRWSASDPVSVSLAAELARLRGDYHVLTARTQVAFDHPLSPGDLTSARAAIASLERKMSAVAEKLRFRQPVDQPAPFDPPSVARLQAALGQDEAVLAYFDDGQHLHAFVIDGARIGHVALAVGSREVRTFQEQFERNLRRSQSIGDRGARTLTRPAQVILEKLGDALLAPVSNHWRGRTRLFIVPYGSLHALPFNLLRQNGRYLIEETEVVTLPGANILLRRLPQRFTGALVLAHDNDGYLPEVEHEARIVSSLLHGTVHSGAHATREALHAPPVQVLHIAAHGAHRTDNPDFSHVALADGQLLTEDVLRMDLSYELVTLSACETGRGRVSAADEALGVGWAFLYAGAGAVVSSLWRVSDQRTVTLMATFYAALKDGMTKAAALRLAQVDVLARSPETHPAFWGAFQLYGSPAALSRSDTGSGGASAPLT